jgi:hypothetical protein
MFDERIGHTDQRDIEQQQTTTQSSAVVHDLSSADRVLSSPCIALYNFKKKQIKSTTRLSEEPPSLIPGEGDFFPRKRPYFNIFSAANEFKQGDQCFMVKKAENKRRNDILAANNQFDIQLSKWNESKNRGKSISALSNSDPDEKMEIFTIK